jgi:putative zinc finger protein
MNCLQLPELCPAYHAGALEPAEALQYREHLAACDACRRADEEYRLGLAALSPWPIEPSSRSDEEFLDALFSEIRRSAGPVLLAGRRPAVRRSFAWWPLALAASLLLVLGGLAWRDHGALVPAPAGEELLADALEPLDTVSPWADLSGLEDSLLEEQAGLAEDVLPVETAAIDPARVEEGFWSDLAGNGVSFDAPWPDAGPSIQEEIEGLDPAQRIRLRASFEHG